MVNPYSSQFALQLLLGLHPTGVLAVQQPTGAPCILDSVPPWTCGLTYWAEGATAWAGRGQTQTWPDNDVKIFCKY